MAIRLANIKYITTCIIPYMIKDRMEGNGERQKNLIIEMEGMCSGKWSIWCGGERRKGALIKETMRPPSASRSTFYSKVYGIQLP
jgi:hypothetical protein